MATGTKLSRRDFLTRTATVAGVATLGAGLSACALAVPAAGDEGGGAPRWRL